MSGKEMSNSNLKYTPWKPSLVFYNNATAELYATDLMYEVVNSDPHHKGVEYCTDLSDLAPALRPQRILVAQIKNMMRASLETYKSLD